MSVAQAYAILEHSSVVELPAYVRRVPGSIPGVPIFQNGGIAMISEFVEYVKQVWKNKPNVSSPLNADRLNHMEAGIENNSKKIKETVTAVNELTEKCTKYCTSGIFNSNLEKNANLIAIGNDSRMQLIGRTIIPFDWTADYNLCLPCKIGSWIFVKNTSTNHETLLVNNGSGTIKGFTAKENEQIIFYGIILI